VLQQDVEALGLGVLPGVDQRDVVLQVWRR
jgi:hypothetical protein